MSLNQSLRTSFVKERENFSQLQNRLLISSNENVSIDIYKQLLMNYLYLSKINEGKFLWENLPAQMKTDKEFQYLALILSSLNFKQYGEFYKLCQIALDNPSTYQLSTTIIEQIRQLILRVSIENVQLIELAYKSISFDDLQNLFGLNQKMIEQICNERHWLIDSDGIHLLPQRNDHSSTTSNSNLAKLVELVSFLER